MTVKPDELTPALFMRLYSVLEMRQEITPDPARAEVLRSLRPLRNDFVHGLKRADDVLRDLAPMLPELVNYLQLLENSSLGSSFAKSMRALSTPEAINDVLLRSIQRVESEQRRSRENPAASTRKEDPVRDGTVRAAAAGDPAAVNKVMSWIWPLVHRYCRARIGGGRGLGAVDSITDAICILIEEMLPSLKNSGELLYVAYNIASHQIAQLPRTIFDLGPGKALGDWGSHMAQLLNELPLRQREVLLLRVVVGLSTGETAKAIGSTPGAVRIAQHRALASLRKQIARMDVPLTLGENAADALEFGKNIAES